MPDDVVDPAGVTSVAPVEPVPVVQPVVVAPLPPPPVVQPQDGVTLTRRELEAHVEKAVARAVEAVQNKTMSDKTPKNPDAPAVDEVAKLREEMTTQLEAIKTESARRTTELETQLAEATKRADEEKKRRRAAREKTVEANLRRAAAHAGIEDEDYALVLYARDASAKVNAKDADGNSAPQPVTDPEVFFANLAKTKPSLLRAGAPLPPARTAPVDNGAAPVPTPPGKVTNDGEKSVMEMDHREFAAKTQREYGFNPAVPY